MIITLTLNPAVDKTIQINDFQLNQVNRVASVRLDAGGKGINVSRVVQMLQENTKAMGVLAGKAGEFIQEQIDQFGIQNEFLQVLGETRTNLKVVDLVRQTNTDINEKGPALSEDQLQQIMKQTLANLKKDHILVLSGSVPENVPAGVYQTLVKEAKKKGARVILDADGQLLRLGLEAGPDLIKPNIHELERLFQEKTHSLAEVIALAKRLFDYPIQTVVVSLGGDGALFMTRNQTIQAKGLKVDVISTVGAGDAMVGALAVGLYQDYPFEKAARLAIATGAASVMTPGTQPGEKETIERLASLVEINRID